MKTRAPIPSLPSRFLRDVTPGRVLAFLAAVAAEPEIRRRLEGAGYDPRVDGRQAWRLLENVVEPPLGRVEEVHSDAFDAMRSLEAWLDPHLRRIGAALAHHHPDAQAFVMHGLAPAEGAGAVLMARALLDRLDVLESGGGDARPGDEGALATLARRGFGPDVRRQLRGLVARAQRWSPPQEQPRRGADLDAVHAALYAWWCDWSATARVVITRRDHLIRLGLATRRRPARAGERAERAGGERSATDARQEPPAPTVVPASGPSGRADPTSTLR